MTIRVFLALFGAAHIVNGVWMITAPAAWYAAVPGVSGTGPFNPHFVTDIGLAYVASGTGLVLGASHRTWSGAAALAGAAWPLLHALFHVREWLQHGLPPSPSAALSEALGVVAIGALGAILAGLRFRNEGGR
jgi:hypothetical protein